MCGRYTGYVDECEELKTIYTEATRRYRGVMFHSGEILPTHIEPSLTGQREGLALVLKMWEFRDSTVKVSSSTHVRRRREPSRRLRKVCGTGGVWFRQRSILSGRVKNGSFCSVSPTEQYCI